MESKPGERVRISTVKESLEGTLLESSEPGIILLKLKSGYNIGLKKEDVTDIEVLKQDKIEKEKELKIKTNKNLPKIDLIITGGTISSRVDYKTGGVYPLTNPSDFLAMYPELLEIVQIRKIKSPFMKLSEDMNPGDWQEIARECEESLNNLEVQGIIITHGTDILHYTSAALSFMLGKLNKPVVLTYAQRSSDRASSDASMNLVCAAHAACSDIAEVMLVGHASTNDDYCLAMLGTKVRKLHSSRRDAFKPVNTRPLVKIFPSGKIEKVLGYNLRNNNKVKVDTVFNRKVALVKYYPGMSSEILDYYSGKYEGIVIEMTGMGHVATKDSGWLSALKKAIDNGLIVCAAAQTVYGRLDPLIYSAGRELGKTGVIYLEDMMAETAYVKLGWVLGHSAWKNKIKEKMLENFAGEINERLQE